MTLRGSLWIAWVVAWIASIALIIGFIAVDWDQPRQDPVQRAIEESRSVTADPDPFSEERAQAERAQDGLPGRLR